MDRYINSDSLIILSNYIVMITQNAILGYILILNLFYFIFLYLALHSFQNHKTINSERQLKDLINSKIYKPVSILVPCYNEEKTVVHNLRNLLNLQYPEFEVIAVNDGSKDRTMEVIKENFNLVELPIPSPLALETKAIRAIYACLDYPGLIVIDKDNGGKSDALNSAMNISQYPLIACIDADSLLETDSLLRMTRAFISNPELIAVGGIVRVLSPDQDINSRFLTMPKTFLERIQVVEYTRSFLSGRTGLSAMGTLLIISGAFGIFSKKAVMMCGGYDTATIGEDMELITRMHRYHIENNIPYRVEFLADPVCWTQAPSDINSLLNQRRRWHKGLFQTILKNWSMLFNPRYGVIGMVGMPFYLFFELLAPFIEISGYIMLVLLYLNGRFDKVFMLLFLITTILLGVLISIGALILDSFLFKRYRKISDILIYTVFSCVEYFGYQQLMSIRKIAMFFEARGQARQWGGMKRKELQK